MVTASKSLGAQRERGKILPIVLRFAADVATILLVFLAALSFRLPIFTGGLYIPASYDFGSVTPGQTCVTKIRVANLHPWPIEIRGVKGGCGCTRAFAARDVPFTLWPLQSESVNISVDAPEKEGAFQQAIRVTTNVGETQLAVNGNALRTKE